jgi:hypothetical protein
MRSASPLALLAVSGAAALFAPAARAEKIYLKNGYEIDGWIVEETKAQVVIAIIKRGSVGRITIDPAEIEQIDRTRKETMEEALARYRHDVALQQQEAARLALLQPQTPTPTAAQPDAKKPEKKSDEVKIPAPTPEEEAKIQDAIQAIGDTRKAGGAGSRRESGVRALVEVGLPSIPYLNDALGDGNWYRRMNAATALGRIAAKDNRLKLYEDAVPKLISLLQDAQPFVRAEANGALEAISGTNQGFQGPGGPDLQPSDLAVVDRWQKWWDQAKGK